MSNPQDDRDNPPPKHHVPKHQSDGSLDPQLNFSLIDRGILTPQQARQLSPSTLAYIGDAVYELYVRLTFLLPPKRIQLHHQQVVEQVRAEGQARQWHFLIPHLDEAEQQILRRGRNAAVGAPRKADPDLYRQATGIEALIGYLYLSDPDRLQALWCHFDFSPAPSVPRSQSQQDVSQQDVSQQDISPQGEAEPD